MSEEQLKVFLAKVKGDTSLQKNLQAAADANAVVSIAKEAGFCISADDLRKAQSEVSDKELEGVAGGQWSVPKGSTQCGWSFATCQWWTMAAGCKGP